MSATHLLMDRVREKKNLQSDSALARFLSVTQGGVSNWRQGTRHPQPHHIEKMAIALEESPIVWALRIQAERDAKADPANAKVWLRWAEQLGKTAASIALIAGIAVYTPRAESHGLHEISQNNPALYIMSNCVNTSVAWHWRSFVRFFPTKVSACSQSAV